MHTERQLRPSLYIFMLVLFLYTPIVLSQDVVLTRDEVVDLSGKGQLFVVNDEDFPATANEFPVWLSQRQAIESVDLFGGAYWFYVELRNNSDITEWIVDPGGTLIEHVELRLYLQEGPTQDLVTGYRAQHDYMLHYGKGIHLQPGATAKLLIRFKSPYFASSPRFEMLQVPAYRQRVAWENILVIAAFGALLTLALYNLFIFSITLDRTFLYYSAYLIAYFTGWAFTFHLPAELFGWYKLNLHYIPFFLLPVLNTLFYMKFLSLRKYFPRLAAWSQVNYWLPLVLLPSCFVALPYAHMLATLVISYWLVIALVSGIASFRSGYRPAGYFVLAFMSLLIPGAIILPANVGLIPDLVRNTELLTLLGGTLDAILLAFALADRIRVLSEQKDSAMQGLNDMLDVARTDHLTGIANRHAFDLDFRQLFRQPQQASDPEQSMLFLIDLDGLKRINDSHGHLRGDELLRTFAQCLAGLESDSVSVYRLGGDEFTILASRSNDEEICSAIARIETQLGERGFEDVGISYGVAFAGASDSPDDMLSIADERMYRYKIRRRHARAEDKQLSSSGTDKP